MLATGSVDVTQVKGSSVRLPVKSTLLFQQVTRAHMRLCVCGQSARYGTSNGQVCESRERCHNDEGNMLQVCPITSVCQMNQWWEQYGSFSLGSPHSTYAACWVSCRTHHCWEGFLRYCYRGPVGTGQHDKTATLVPVFPDHNRSVRPFAI